MTTPTDDATKRTPAKIIAACRTALNLLDVPAAPVGDDAELWKMLIDASHDERLSTGMLYRRAAARIAELERDIKIYGDDCAAAERQLAAALACIKAADAMVDFVFCVDREAYDKARLRFAGDDAFAPGSP